MHMITLCVVCTLYCMFLNVNCTSLSKRQEFFLVQCLENNTDWIQSLPKRKRCIAYRNSIRLLSFSGNNNLSESENAIHKTTQLDYISALINWRNKEGTFTNTLLKRVVPCYNHSKELRKTWRNFFEKRSTTVGIAPVILRQQWNCTIGEITLALPRKRYSADKLIAAELIISRLSPSDIGEQFGRYVTTVLSVEEDRPSKKIHFDHQTSCPTSDGRLMVLDLQTELLVKWLRGSERNITLSVQVHPRQRQYFNTRGVEQGDVKVVEEIAGLLLHFEHTGEESFVTKFQTNVFDGKETYFQTEHLSPATVNSRYEGILRTRRSSIRSNTLVLPRDPPSSTCKKMSLTVPKEVITSEHVIFPTNEAQAWNIRKCVGPCRHPITSEVDKTNHAIALSMYNRKSVCCVPIAYDSLNYAHVLNDGQIIMDLKTNMVATKCGCR